MDVKGKNVVVAGMGKSGIGAAKLLLEVGAYVILYDQKVDTDLDKVRGQFDSLEGLSFILGELKESLLDNVVGMVLSPGISAKAPFVDLFRNKNIPVWSEVELAFRISKGSLCAITGTNGKTTTTALTGEIMKAWNESTFVVGNIGTPYTTTALSTNEGSITVAEISSFQLETIIDFNPKVSAILNVTPDHLDRHGTFEEYAQTKLSITKNQSEDQVCVLNYDDKITRKFAKKISAKPVFFSRLTNLEEGVCIKEDAIVLRTKEKEEEICKIKELKLLGGHNIENVMAAVAISYYMGVSVSCIHKVITEFMGVEHRIEYVDTINGVAYYNDSKGTNPDAAIKGIQAMERPTILIGGGYDKGVAFDDWIEAFDGKVRYLLLLGVTAKQIETTANQHGFTQCIHVESLEEAVKKASELARDGDAVLLSPACASWGMFDNYEQRGQMFKEYVGNLK